MSDINHCKSCAQYITYEIFVKNDGVCEDCANLPHKDVEEEPKKEFTRNGVD